MDSRWPVWDVVVVGGTAAGDGDGAGSMELSQQWSDLAGKDYCHGGVANAGASAIA